MIYLFSQSREDRCIKKARERLGLLTQLLNSIQHKFIKLLVRKHAGMQFRLTMGYGLIQPFDHPTVDENFVPCQPKQLKEITGLFRTKPFEDLSDMMGDITLLLSRDKSGQLIAGLEELRPPFFLLKILPIVGEITRTLLVLSNPIRANSLSNKVLLPS